MGLAGIEKIDLTGLKRGGIEKKQFGHDFVYRYPASKAMPIINKESLFADLKETDFSAVQMAFYLHLPFCTSICSYCHYFKQLPSSSEIELCLKAMKKEIATYSEFIDSKTKPNSVFFGGGTPTLLKASQLNSLLQFLAESFEFGPGQAETTIESSPETLDEAKLFSLREDGFNRLSIGMQDFNDAVTKKCNRNHNREQALNAFDFAKSAGFRNINIDLIYGLPGQTAKLWKDTLAKISELKPQSVTASDLRILPGTRFYSVQRNEFPNVEQILGMYSLFVEEMLSLGYKQQFPYQFVKPGSEMRFLENQWSNGQFVGFRPSSCSYLAKWDYNNAFPLKKYLEFVAENKIAAAVGKKLGKGGEMIRFFALALKKSGINRPKSGINKKRFRQKFGLTVEEAFGKKIDKLKALGLIEDKGNWLGLSKKGLFFHDEIAKQFFQPMLMDSMNL